MVVKYLARELAATGIRANMVEPGMIGTRGGGQLMMQFSRKSSDPERQAIASPDTIPMKAFGRGTDVAELVVFLASSKAQYITGQAIAVDGGLSL